MAWRQAIWSARRDGARAVDGAPDAPALEPLPPPCCAARPALLPTSVFIMGYSSLDDSGRSAAMLHDGASICRSHAPQKGTGSASSNHFLMVFRRSISFAMRLSNFLTACSQTSSNRAGSVFENSARKTAFMSLNPH